MLRNAGWLLSLLVIVGLPVACTASPTSSADGQIGPGMRMDEGMMQRHMAPIPAEYARLANPVPADAESVAQGRAIYETPCATCHGEEGQGNGPAAANLDPPPAPVAHTSQMLSDAYLFYRISEGGNFAPFNSAMPAFAEILSERERWDVINYIRSLNDGMMDGGTMMNCMVGFGMMGGMMALGLLLLIILILAAVLLIVWLVRRPGQSSASAESPQEILKRRYARGEIDSEQYEAMKRQINER